MSELLYERASGLMVAELNDEMVGLEPDAGLCFGFNAVAKRVWELLEEPRSLDQLLNVLLAEYDVSGSECAADVSSLLESLVGHGLVRRR